MFYIITICIMLSFPPTKCSPFQPDLAQGRLSRSKSPPFFSRNFCGFSPLEGIKYHFLAVFDIFFSRSIVVLEVTTLFFGLHFCRRSGVLNMIPTVIERFKKKSTPQAEAQLLTWEQVAFGFKLSTQFDQRYPR